MDLFYTWYDVERKFKLQNWNDKWKSVDVYNDEIVINTCNQFSEEDYTVSDNTLKEMFGHHYSKEGRYIRLDFGDKVLKVTHDYSEGIVFAENQSLPLFRDIARRLSEPKDLKGVPVIAFHSYKGGVGRTLSLLSTVKALSTKRNSEKNRQYRLLIVDSDIEAPGLTWLAETQGLFSDMSLLDALALVHDNKNWEEVLPFVAKKIKETTLRLPIEKQIVEHFFLPAYREVQQVMHMPTTPENIIKMNDREWVISDFFSELGKELEVDAVLIDLRAGISEFSAPLLFDPRVRKIYVSSTSLQSRRGLQTILKQIYAKPLHEKYPNPSVLISMVPEEVDNDDRMNMADEFLEVFKSKDKEQDIDRPLDRFVEFLSFSSNLVHLEGFDSIDGKLSNSEMSKSIEVLVSDWVDIKANFEKEKIISDKKKTQFLRKLVTTATEMEHAETKLISNFLTTIPLKNITRKYRYTSPISVVLGAKGSGKTFAYLQLLRSATWENFVNKVEGNNDNFKTITHVVPFMKPKNLAEESVNDMAKHMEELNTELGFKLNIRSMLNLIDEIELFEPKTGTEAEWKMFWRKKIIKFTGLPFERFEELQEYLEQANKRVLFVADGLEELFLNVTNSSKERTAVRALCQGIINELRSIPDGRIGLILLLRRDVAINSVEQNWTQFYSQYSSFELKWTNVEALRLALWLSCEVDSSFCTSQIPIENLTGEALEEKLYPLWGVKLGRKDSKEAYSANWIIAVLSDLNEQLQARDIIRFLRYAAIESTNTTPLNDRYLSPSGIRNAIKPCSEQKIKEIEQEMPLVQKIFSKLQTKVPDQKQVPFQLEEFGLSNEEARFLEQQGYLVKIETGYYMPEIIRRGLGFNLQSGARPKVFALLKRAQRRK
ncbi:hypothetical protein HPY31_21015 [Brevibacillus sp. HB1.3]|uniref:KGGVGR-motif variant AAA ATPase n=1 Tax=Brevibacillus sp. HB1.3 TaxID=2738842 RepID=UPI001552D3D2|nr:hypothetical protein [Brevibacillus sp. HB1.3]NQF16367.1 hypothetical protein [Brevibacillus sp. HB1.3]